LAKLETMKATLLLLLAALPLGTAQARNSASDAPAPRNVLFIAVDDLRPELGCFGVTHARSPHIDRLASEGVLFTHHYVQVPTCGASRYALLTGRSPARSGVRNGNAAFYRGKSALSATELPGAQTLPELFRRSGYRTVCIGKISHTGDGRVFEYDGSGDGRPELPNAWDELATPYGPWKRGWGAFFAYAGGKHREDGEGHRDLLEFVAEEDEELPDGLIARRAVESLRALKKGGEPFFLGVGFYKPHLPFVATRKDLEAVKSVDIPPPPRAEKTESAYWHKSGEFYGYHAPFPKKRPLAEEDAIATRRAYLACIRYVDRQVGVVLDALDELGLRESTVVVLWGDHGWHLGDSAVWGKHTPLERALHSPLLIRAPGIGKAGVRCDTPVETIDIYPTLIDLCRPTFTRTHHALDGTSLLPILSGEEETVHPAAISYWGKATSIRTPEHRLVVSGPIDNLTRIELYDATDGPDPIRDLAGEEPKIVARLLRLIPPRSDR
jgi:arylsulfatase A-like enzyme